LIGLFFHSSAFREPRAAGLRPRALMGDLIDAGKLIGVGRIKLRAERVGRYVLGWEDVCGALKSTKLVFAARIRRLFGFRTRIPYGPA
jgi:hypothetical protein